MCSRLSERSRIFLFCKLCRVRISRTVLLFARIKIEWVIAVVPFDFTPAQKRAVANTGCAENNVFALSEIVGGVNAVEILFPTVGDELFLLFFVTRPHFGLH